jgi:hypothetical protein
MFIPCVNELEEQRRLFPVQVLIPNFIDHQHMRLLQPLQLPLQTVHRSCPYQLLDCIHTRLIVCGEARHTRLVGQRKQYVYCTRVRFNNMGRILCTVQTTGISKMSTKTTSYDSVQDVKVDYEDIRQWFQLTFPDSAWNDKEWERVLHYK